MTSNTQGLGKSLSVPPQPTYSPASQSSPATPSFDSARRPTSQSTASPQPNPRKGQASRKQHRNQRRPMITRASDLDDDDMAELSAVRNASSRRGQTSITHLMSYSVGPRPYDHSYRSSASSRYSRNPTWGPGSGHRVADKARYVHANYRFVVSPRGDYRKHAVDANELLDWADVLQVLASTESQAASCPICLSEPVAPRMAKCGHIFCLPCLIRFMNSSSGDDKNGSSGGNFGNRTRWKKCPLCEDGVYMHEVRPVRFYAGQESPLPRPGDDVVLRLMVRTAKSTVALPRETDILSVGPDIPWHFAANVLDYARIMKGTGNYMMEQHDAEIEALKKQEKEDEIMFHEDGEWTQRAIKAINAAKEKLADLGGLEAALPSVVGGQSTASAAALGSDSEFYFYSSLPHLYLSPLDIRILKTKYGAFSSFPSTLLPRVEHISTGHTVDDAVRRRARYLGHLPQGCLISFLECDWTDIVPAEVLATFADEIERRRKRNRDKAAQEERERLQAERIEAAALRSGARRTTHLPATEEEVLIRFGGGGGGGGRNVVNPDEFIPLGAEAGTPPNPRSGFSQLADMSTSPSAPRTVWGTPALPPSASGPDSGRPPPSSAVVDDGWLKDEQVLDSLVGGVGADLAAQMEGLGVEGDPGAATPSSTGTGGGGGGGKKKKKLKITLMSTGGRRGT